MKLVDSKMSGWQKLLFFLCLGLAYFLYVNLTGDESWLLSSEEKQRRRAYTIAQQFINRTYAPPSPATFPPIESVSIQSLESGAFLIEGWVLEPDANGDPQRFDYTIQLVKTDNTWKAPMFRFKQIVHEASQTKKVEKGAH